MGTLYCYNPSGIKTAIATFENGYVNDIFNRSIGKYTNDRIYPGTSFLNDHIGDIRFNYGYLAYSNDIFVTAHNDGSLSVKGERYAAYYDGDPKGAIAAYIVCYNNGLIYNTDKYYTSSSPKNETVTTQSPAPQSSTSKSTSIGLPIPAGEASGEGGFGGGCAVILGGIVLAVLCVIAAFQSWGDVFEALATGDDLDIYWPALLYVAAVIFSLYFIFKKSFTTFGEIASIYLCSLAGISVVCGVIIGAHMSFWYIFLAPIAMAILAIPVFVVCVPITWIIVKIVNASKE